MVNLNLFAELLFLHDIDQYDGIKLGSIYYVARLTDGKYRYPIPLK